MFIFCIQLIGDSIGQLEINVSWSYIYILQKLANCYTINSVQVSSNLPQSLNLITPVSSLQVTGQRKGCPIPTVMTRTYQTRRMFLKT